MLSDFGVSTQLTDANTSKQTVIGTPFWMAPEILQGRVSIYLFTAYLAILL